MAITAVVDATKTPIELTVKSDKRKISGTVQAGQETAKYETAFEPIIKDDSGRKWTKKSDDGVIAVYTG